MWFRIQNLWMVLSFISLLPLFGLLFDILFNQLGANPIEAVHIRLGDWSLRFLCLTLAITPLQNLTKWRGIVDAYNNRKFKGVVTKIASSTKSNALTSSNDVTNYEVRIRLDKESYKDLSERRFPFRPGMNASADIKTRRVENVLAVPIAAVSARVKGSDQSMADKKKEKENSKDENEAQNQNGVVVEGDELEEVAFVLMPDGTVKKRVVKTGVQDINYIEIVSGLKEGEELITAPYAAVSKDLKDGAKVTVVPKDKLFDKK